ncbi:hypothetical protein CLF_110606 [Clonorchis sinensis]|uniref:Uncharacterized protein n=1 Tax=Clonorchis sinensis TaxID=79923 RepID=G7YKX5_CLOSI|nr:hypothetical protein CLF_110606 [Clonorchis sinensis]
MLGNGEDTADSTNSELPILSKLLKTLHSRPTSDMLETIITLLHELSLESDSPLPIPHTGIDASAMLERLHFLCCSWYHRDHRPDEDYVSSSSNCIPVGTPTLPPVLSSVNGLACGRNKTLSFHTLDSLEQPGLVWSLTGFRVQTASSESGAAIVDKAAGPTEGTANCLADLSIDAELIRLTEYHQQRHCSDGSFEHRMTLSCQRKINCIIATRG